MAKKPRTYQVSIVGESFYRSAIKETDEGDYVDLVKETGNPHAKNDIALRVDNTFGDTIGYIPEDNWLYQALIVENKNALARVSFKDGRPAGIRLEVQLESEGNLPSVEYEQKLPQPTGCLIILAVGLLTSQIASTLI